MSPEITHPSIGTCPNCNADLPLAALACPQCQALTYSDRLDQLAKDARALETRGRYLQARELWESTLPLLPPESKQTTWVHDRLLALDDAQAKSLSPNGTVSVASGSVTSQAGSGQVGPGPIGSNQAPSPKPSPPQPGPGMQRWIKKLGPFGPVLLLLFKLKSLLFLVFKLKFLFSFAAFIVIYVGLFGWRYGLGISACLLIHEMGHYIDIKRRGLPAEMPVFLPGMGAYVRWNALGVTRRQIAQISLAGPLAGWIAAAVCVLIYAQTGDPLWAALARTGAFLNTLNLIPVWVLDGGQAASALGVSERTTLLATALGLWYFTGEGLFLIVAIGFAWRLFTGLKADGDKPEQSDWLTFAYYVAVLIALGLVLQVVPETMMHAVRDRQ